MSLFNIERYLLLKEDYEDELEEYKKKNKKATNKDILKFRAKYLKDHEWESMARLAAYAAPMAGSPGFLWAFPIGYGVGKIIDHSDHILRRITGDKK